MQRAALALAVLAAGCLRQTEYRCTSSSQCTGTGGVCEPATGYCSFPDTGCGAGGRRYDSSSGAYAGQCVGVAGSDAGPDGPPDTPGPGCPSGYALLPGVTGHLYKLTGNTAAWDTQSTRCTGDGANVYLAIADDQTELTALITAASQASVWVGITDQVTEGVYLTTKGQTATFLPWESGQPDNQGGNGGQDCVAGQMATSMITDERCSDTNRAVCECEP